jgi:predicted DNA binding CopG/RHH family protein
VKKKSKQPPPKKPTLKTLPTPKPLQLGKTQESNLGDLEDVTPIIQFLEMFQQLADPRAQLPLKLISLKVPVPLLEAFKFRCQHLGVPYQTMIKRLMKEWLERHP